MQSTTAKVGDTISMSTLVDGYREGVVTAVTAKKCTVEFEAEAYLEKQSVSIPRSFPLLGYMLWGRQCCFIKAAPEKSKTKPGSNARAVEIADQIKAIGGKILHVGRYYVGDSPRVVCEYLGIRFVLLPQKNDTIKVMAYNTQTDKPYYTVTSIN